MDYNEIIRRQFKLHFYRAEKMADNTNINYLVMNFTQISKMESHAHNIA